MAAIVSLGDVTANAEMVETEPKIDTESLSSNGESTMKDNGKCENDGKAVEEPNSVSKVATEQEEAKKEEVAVEIEPKTRVSFPFKLDDGKQLGCVGLRKKSKLGMGIKIYGFCIIEHYWANFGSWFNLLGLWAPLTLLGRVLGQ